MFPACFHLLYLKPIKAAPRNVWDAGSSGGGGGGRSNHQRREAAMNHKSTSTTSEDVGRLDISCRDKLIFRFSQGVNVNGK